MESPELASRLYDQPCDVPCQYRIAAGRPVVLAAASGTATRSGTTVTTTEADGTYTLAGLPTGTYAVTLSILPIPVNSVVLRASVVQQYSPVGLTLTRNGGIAPSWRLAALPRLA